MKRLFLAIRPGRNLLDYFDSYRKDLADVSGIRWMPEENVHLTMHFMGNTEPDVLEEIRDRLQEVLKNQQRTQLQLKFLGNAPGKRPKPMIWASFESSAQYDELVFAIRAAIDPFAKEGDKRKPLPHITLARAGKPPFTSGSIPLIKPEGDLFLEVEDVQLWESTLTQSGSFYRCIEIWQLGNEN